MILNRQCVHLLGIVLVWLITVLTNIAYANVSATTSLQSKYLWGGVLMDEGAVLQASLKYTHDTGLFVGSWFSTVDVGSSDNNQIDLFAGYSSSVKRLKYDVGIVSHNFTGSGPVDNDTNAVRGYFSGALGAMRVFIKTPLTDASWTSKGDIYAGAGWVKELSDGLRVSALAGFYYFADDAVFDNGTLSISRKQSFAFRNATFSLVHSLQDTPLELGVHVGIGGERRDGSELDNHLWFSVEADFQ